LRLEYISTKEGDFKGMVLCFRIFEPKSLNIVNQDMTDKGIPETNLPFRYTVNDNEFILKVASQNCKCYAGFERDVEYNTDVGVRKYTIKKGMDILAYYKI